MRLLIIGPLSGELGRAASIAVSRGASIDQADNMSLAMEKLRRDASFSLAFCDVREDLGGLVATLALERINVGVVACGISTEPHRVAMAIRSGVRDFLPLPPDADLIAALLVSATGSQPSIIARDGAMLDVINRARQVARSDASVMISGESGSGKEVLARHIHQLSRRSRGPFIALNCAAIPDNLLESELFGHEKGAFSGAVARRIGKFEAANGGTLLLDEISEMDIRLQAKLLRALQEREIDRLGSSSPVRLDVRILATSNRDMQPYIDGGHFRADLYFRLNVINIEVPPLRRRPNDILELAHFYANHYSKLNGLPERPLSTRAIETLETYHWPGNVRELENTIHRAVLLSTGSELEVDCLLSPARQGTSMAVQERKPTTSSTTDEADVQLSGLVGRSVEEVERALIIQTLSHTSGNRTHAAAILGISIRALRNKLRDYTALGFQITSATAGTSV